MYKFQALKPRVRLLPIVSSRKKGFTLLELLVSIAIVGILASILLVAMSRVQLEAKKKRTQQQVNKIDHLLRPLVNDVLNRPLKIQFSTPLPPRPQKPKRNEFPPPPDDAPYKEALAQYTVNLDFYMRVVKFRRFQILTFRRELLRMEMPDRKTDVTDPAYKFYNKDGTVAARQLPNSRNQQYRAAVEVVKNTWTPDYQDSECLYLILSTLNDRNVSALDFLLPSEIGDLDKDGMPELLDAFGNPLGFLRWAPGLSARVGPDGFWGACDPNTPDGSLGDNDGDGFDDADDDRNGIINDAGEYGMGAHDDYRSFSAIQSHNPVISPDWTDVAGVDPRLSNTVYVPKWSKKVLNLSDDTFNLLPLICSAGQDGTFGVFGLRADGDRIPERGQTFPGLNDYLDSFSYQSPNLIYDPPVIYDPFVSHNFTDVYGVRYQFGAFFYKDGYPRFYLDNISNHDIQETQ